MELPRRIERRASDRIISWIHDPGNREDSFEETVRGLARALLAEGVAVWRVSSSLRTFQPEVAVRNVVWNVDDDSISASDISRERVAGRAYHDSPLLVSRTEGRSLLVSLEGDEAQVFPICADLKAEGGTAYWVHAMPRMLGTFVSFATRESGGFSSEEVALFESILPAISLRIELFCSRWGLQSLLHLYLGGNAARHVLDGEFSLARGHEIDAVIWLCDLRGFTTMTETHAIGTVLQKLNSYFSCVVVPIEEQGGEVLKFVGDAVLAIFPFGNDGARAACARAIEAARAAFRAMAVANEGLDEAETLNFGLGLHLGPVAYGNIGTASRLDFTVIGPAVNETARIEALCPGLGRPFLVSNAFANAAGCDELVSLGFHKLKGVAAETEVFTMPCVYAS